MNILDAEQRRRAARPRPRRLPDAARRDPRRRPRPRSTPGYRHIDTAAAYGNEREVGEAVRALRPRPLRRLPRDQDLDQRLRLRRDAARLREERRQARRRPDRPADPAPGAARAPSTGPSRPTGRWRRCSPTARSAPSASATSWSTTSPTLLDRADGRPGRQPDRGAPVLRPAGGPGLRRRARHPHPGLVADRRHHLLPRRRAHQHPRRPGHRRHRRGARQDPGPGDAALGHAARPLGHPEVHQAAAASPRTSTSSTSSSPPTSSPRSTRSTPAAAAAPSPTPSRSRPSAARSPRPDLATSGLSSRDWLRRPTAIADRGGRRTLGLMPRTRLLLAVLATGLLLAPVAARPDERHVGIGDQQVSMFEPAGLSARKAQAGALLGVQGVRDMERGQPCQPADVATLRRMRPLLPEMYRAVKPHCRDRAWSWRSTCSTRPASSATCAPLSPAVRRPTGAGRRSSGSTTKATSTALARNGHAQHHPAGPSLTTAHTQFWSPRPAGS